MRFCCFFYKTGNNKHLDISFKVCNLAPFLCRLPASYYFIIIPFMKKPIILLFVLLCGNMFASAQIKIMLESEVEKKKNESAAAKQQAAKPSYQIYADDYIPVKKNTGEKVIPKKTDARPEEKELTYAEITRKRQQRRKEGKLTDLEEIQAQLKELEHLK